jgi:hypothetical protein
MAGSDPALRAVSVLLSLGTSVDHQNLQQGV